MIEVKELSKSYGAFEAVKNVSFSVGKDQVVGLLGPNGAGKTTIMKILTGYHFPSSGTALIDGISAAEFPVEVKKRIGYLPESVPLNSDLTPEETLKFVAAAREIPKAERKEAIDRSIEACGLGAYRNRKIDTLSKGYKQRVGLAQAIIHDPPILILDEPTTGLDPNQIIEIRALMTELGKSKTVILSTHIMQEVEAVCSNVLILNEGKIAAQGTPEEISLAMESGNTWSLIVKCQGGLSDAPSWVRDRLSSLGKEAGAVSAEGRDDGTVRLTFSLREEEAGEAIFDWAVAQNFKLLEMNRKSLSLEDIFVKLTEGGKP
jgi:ABC-2 type transport system ATP-binding protein